MTISSFKQATAHIGAYLLATTQWPALSRLALVLVALLFISSPACDNSDSSGGSDKTLPTVETLGAEMVSATAETVSGSINPNGEKTEYWFEWETDKTLENPNRTAIATLGASSSQQMVSGEITGLSKGTAIYYRLCARNSDGTVRSEVKTCHHYASVAFVTSARGTGNLGSWAEAHGEAGIEAGDAICQTLAGDAELPGEFSAWISDSNIDARDRLVRSAENYMRVDGVRLADNWSDLTTTPYLENPISIDEEGSSATYGVFTGTRVGGTAGVGIFGNACLDWRSGDGTDGAATGVSGYADYKWTELVRGSCDVSRPLYCFQQNIDLPQEHFNTECPGPYGWEWHVSRCSNGLYQDPDCAYICCNFYDGTSNCNNLPATFGAYTVNSCSYNTGVYSMSVTSGGENFSVTCQLH
ncbi:MAG: hypothetical protein JRE71_01805 [Deltaproteobacteria bacterium]|nr:hypothetical protein [Deltaproteobacteria bacterium]